MWDNQPKQSAEANCHTKSHAFIVGCIFLSNSKPMV